MVSPTLVCVTFFLGMLHMEIVQERLEREFDFDLVTTAPSVIYLYHEDIWKRDHIG